MEAVQRNKECVGIRSGAFSTRDDHFAVGDRGLDKHRDREAASQLGAKDIGRAAAGGIIAVILANIVAYFLMRSMGKNLDA